MKYQSLVTRSNIDSCLEQIPDEQSKKEFLALILKLDIRLEFIKGDEENYYKIWVIRKDRRKRAWYTDYYRSVEDKDRILIPTLKEILSTLRLLIDVPKSYRKYSMQRCLSCDKEDYIRDLRFAHRFKDVLDMKNIKSIPFFESPEMVSSLDDQDYQEINAEVATNMERFTRKILENEIRKCRRLGFTTIRISAINEFEYLLDLEDDMQHSQKLLRQYGFDEVGKLNLKKFPVPRSDKEIEGIENDISNYDNKVRNALGYVEQLASKYGKALSPKGVIFYPPRKGRNNKLTTPIIITFS